jgi:signal transduction histidine kinase
VERSGEAALIHVGDTGPGIPEEVRGRIFDPFFTTKPGGTGLGLAIASQNIRGLGGRLDLERSDRFRTVFKLTLPLGEGKQASDSHRSGREESAGRDPAALSAVPGAMS